MSLTRCDQCGKRRDDVEFCKPENRNLCSPCFRGEPSSNGASPRGRRLRLTRASSILSERLRWFLRDRIPIGGLTVIAGEKGLGKSILSNAHLVAEATQGRLDGELRGNPVDVLIATAEDSWAAVIKPRLMAHGADLDRVHRVEIVDDAGEQLLTLPDDARLFEEEIKRLTDEGRVVGMLVIDPIGAFLSGPWIPTRTRMFAARWRRWPTWPNAWTWRSSSSPT